MNSAEKLKYMAKVLDDKKAQDIVAIKINNLTVVADYFLIASGTSTTHVKALADELEFKLKEKDISPLRVEGYNSSAWVLLDLGDILVHLFLSEVRNFYGLERLWVDGTSMELSSLLNEQEQSL